MIKSKAKPLPSQIRIGADIAHVPRLTKLLSKYIDSNILNEVQNGRVLHRQGPSSLERWARKIFHDLEWPQLDYYVRQLALSPRRLGGLTDGNAQALKHFVAGRYAYFS